MGCGSYTEVVVDAQRGWLTRRYHSKEQLLSTFNEFKDFLFAEDEGCMCVDHRLRLHATKDGAEITFSDLGHRRYGCGTCPQVCCCVMSCIGSMKGGGLVQDAEES